MKHLPRILLCVAILNLALAIALLITGELLLGLVTMAWAINLLIQQLTLLRAARYARWAGRQAGLEIIMRRDEFRL